MMSDPLEPNKNYGGKTNMWNNDPFMPWNDLMERDDPFKPWNDQMYRHDPFAPWNQPLADEKDYQKYCDEQHIPERDR